MRKKYVIPEFREDSVQSFSNKYVKDGVYPSIIKSNAIIEIRFFEEVLFRGTVGRMYTIQYFSDSVVAKDITFSYAPYQSEAKEDSLYEFIGKDSAGFFINRLISTLSANLRWDSALSKLVTNKAFALRDHYAIFNELVKQKTSLTDPYKDHPPRHFYPNMILEIKLKNHFRNIRINQAYSRANDNVPDFNCEKNIGDMFNFLFNNIKPPKK